MRRIVAAYTKSDHHGTLHRPGIQHARAGLGDRASGGPWGVRGWPGWSSPW